MKLYDFIKKTTLNKNIISITTDLDPKYVKIMEKLGFQHQLYIFHAKNALNKALKNKNLPKKEHKKAQKQLKKVTNIFDYEKYEKANKELQELNFKENEFIPEVWQIIKKLILPRYKKFIYHIQNKKIPKTSNLIENVFSKTMPKYKKRIFKTKKGLLKRIYEKDNLWNQNRQKQKAKNKQT